MPGTQFPRTSITEGLGFIALVGLPNVAQGLFRRRPAVVATLDRLGVYARGHRLLAALHRRYGDGPVWVQAGAKPTLLIFGPDQIRYVLSNAPDPFASDPEPKRSGMLKFQPHALTISRDPDWSDRRRFTDAVLGCAHADQNFQHRFAAIAAEEAARHCPLPSPGQDSTKHCDDLRAGSSWDRTHPATISYPNNWRY